jgi:hypothetical protein
MVDGVLRQLGDLLVVATLQTLVDPIQKLHRRPPSGSFAFHEGGWCFDG